MKEPKVSVIVPVYNVAPYLSQCLDSLVNQTYRNLEIIVVDDGSTDESGDICEQWKERDNRIKLIHKANAGLGEARNTGLEHVTGEYVGFVDSDDYVDRTMYEKMVEAALKHDADVVQCNYNRFFNDGSVKKKGDFDSERVFAGGECRTLANALVNGHNGLTTGLLHAAVWVCLFRRGAINCRFISERIVGSEDIPFKASVFMECAKVVFIPDHLCFYRYNDTSLTRVFRYDLFTRYINLTDNLNAMFSKYGCNAHQADFLMLYMAIVVIRYMYMFNCPADLRPGYFRRLVNEDVWKRLKIDTAPLGKGEKLIYYCIRNRNYRLLQVVASLYYSVRKYLPS